RQFVRAACRTRRLLLRLQRDGSDAAVAHHQSGAARRQGHRDGRLFQSAVLGIFVGGVIGGLAHQHGGGAAIFALTTALALIWLLTAVGMAQPSYLTTRLLPLAGNRTADVADLAAKLRQVTGVVEAVVVAEENLAYLKVD